MRIAIIGRTEMLMSTAKQLRAQGHEIVLVVAGKAAPEYKVTDADFESFAREVGAAFILSGKMTPEVVAQIKSHDNIDIGISVNYPNIIGDEVIDLFPLGILNAHGGDLPKYRGNACLAWAILNGEPRVGLCVHKMVGGALDSGDIISRSYREIDINTKVGVLQDWLNEAVAGLFLEAVEKLQADPSYVLEVQSTDPKDILRGYPRKAEDGRIDWSADRENVLRLINACNHPYAGAFCELEGKKLIVWDATLYEDQERYAAVNGQVAEVTKQGVIVICGNGKLLIKEIEIDGEVKPANEIITSIRKRLT